MLSTRKRESCSDTEIVVIERHSVVLRRNARRLRVDDTALAFATLLLTGDTLIEQIGGRS